MGRINVLDFEIANLIAAGEVVERPSSVMKELIENSIDAGATAITAEIKRGGVALIRVSDNGHGIEKDDLPIALKRHATSKIGTKEDLESITTLGFRGEALAAISSVSEVTIITKTPSSDTAYMLTSEAGRVLDVCEVGAADGTTVVVENLFFNVPARRKFLKKDSTEAMNVAALVEKVALSRPDISVQLLIDGEERFKTPGDGDLKNTVYAVFGRELSSKLIPLDAVVGHIRVHGFIGRSDNTRKNRNLENVFINGRYVKSLTAQAAIEKAYTSYIAPEAFPVCMMFIEMDPALVDVNVHPTKLEVKFSDEKSVFEAVYYTVRNAIEGYEYRPEMQIGQNKRPNPLAAFASVTEGEKHNQQRLDIKERAFGAGKLSAKKESVTRDTSFSPKASPYLDPEWNKPIRVSSDKKGGFPDVKRETATPKSSIELLQRYHTAKPAEQPARALDEPKAELKPTLTPGQESVADLPEYKIVGEAFDCYVLVEIDNYLLVIDKHAAHERLIFEELKKTLSECGSVLSQTLLLPITAMLSPGGRAAAEEFRADIEAVGFEFGVNGDACDIYSIPQDIGEDEAEALFVKMADELAEGKGNPTLTDMLRREKALYQIACKAAIKGGRSYNSEIVKSIVERVLALPDVTVCPHGRPIAYKLTKNELDKQFDRIK